MVTDCISSNELRLEKFETNSRTVCQKGGTHTQIQKGFTNFQRPKDAFKEKCGVLRFGSG